MKRSYLLYLAVFLAIGLTTILSLSLAQPAGAQTARLKPSSPPCAPRAITATMSAPDAISDTRPGAAEGRVIYFANHQAGVITLSVAVSESCHVWGGPAFGLAQPAPLLPLTGALRSIAYPVSVAHGSVNVALTSSLSLTGTLSFTFSERAVLTFTRDVTAPADVRLVAPARSGRPDFLVQWSADDAGAGVAAYTVEYTRAGGGPGTAFLPWLTYTTAQSAVFHAPFTETTYLFRVTAYDFVGNSARSDEAATFVGLFRIYLPLTTRDYPPSWRKTSGLGVKTYDISVCPTNPAVQYAGTEAGVYRSTDGGQTWSAWALSGLTRPVVVNPANCNQAFVAVWGSGVYSVTGVASPATQVITNGLADINVYGLALSGTLLYAGTDTAGVYATSIHNVNWTARNLGIAGVDGRIRSLYAADGVLYAGGRRCTYYASNNGGGLWVPVPVLGGGNSAPCEDAQVWAVAAQGGAHYAGLGLSKGLYRNPGLWWEAVSGVPQATIYNYGLLPYGGDVYVSVYGHGVYRCAGGDCARLPNTGLGNLNTRGLAIAELGGQPRLLVASDNGVWYLPLSPGKRD